MFGAHISEVPPAPGNKTSGRAVGGPLMRTNVAPNAVGTNRSSDAIGQSLAAKPSR
jgi:hypothetical protein